jgi:hypothetical protein
MCKALGSIPSTPKTYSNNPINPILKTIQNALTDKAVTYGLWTYFMLACILDLTNPRGFWDKALHNSMI